MAGVVSLPHHPQGSHLDKGRSHGHLVFASIALGVIGLVVLVGYLVVPLMGKDIGKGIGDPLNGLQAMWQGGSEASTAAGFASSEGLTYGQLTQTQLEARFPSTNWLSASTVRTYTYGQGTNVSFLATGDHVVTAVAEKAGLCSWGLAVQSSSDPIITADGLSGPSVYWTFTSATTAQFSGGNPPCDASAAPTSRWSPLEGAGG
jgi:hypothetical protein